MNKIDEKFAELASAGRKGLFPFLVAGQPDVESMCKLIQKLDEIGVSGIELGFPFTDPVADGPVIQSAFSETLSRGVTVEKIFEGIAKVRSMVSIPLIAMVSASIVYRIGTDNFFDRAKEAGFDGFIIPDLSLEEAPALAAKISDRDLRMIMLVAPTSPIGRQEKIAKIASGFIYYMSVAGITGERDKLPDDMKDNVAKLEQLSGAPVVVGFGISNPQQVEMVCSVADGAIVGSAIIRRITEAEKEGQPPEQITETVSDYVRTLMSGLG